MPAPNHAERLSAIERSRAWHEGYCLFASVDDVPASWSIHAYTMSNGQNLRVNFVFSGIRSLVKTIS
jgi:hypothetical protein